jgi:hypothetical protein
MGNTDTFNYCANAGTSDCLDTATGSGIVSVSDSAGNSTVYDYDQGTEAAQTTKSSSGVLSERDVQPDTASGTLLSTSGTDGLGNTVKITADALGNKTASVTFPVQAGAATTTTTSGCAELPDCTSAASASATCASAAGPAPVTAGGAITPPASVPPAGVSWTQYDSQGNDLYTEIGVSTPGSNAPATAQVTYELHAGNSVSLPGTSTTVTCANTAPRPSSRALPSTPLARSPSCSTTRRET